MQRLMKYIPVAGSMPSAFRETLENRISDPKKELFPLWKKISQMNAPVRIVHIGDSHVRGQI